MSQNNIIAENLQLLDNTLNYLTQSETLSLHIDYLRIKLIKETDKKLKLKNSDNNSIQELFIDIFSVPTQKTQNLVKINEVLLLLESEKLIRLIEQNHIRITYQGIIQHSKGYVKEYDKQTSDETRLLNVEKFQKRNAREMFWITFLIMIGTLIAAIYYSLEILALHVCLCK